MEVNETLRVLHMPLSPYGTYDCMYYYSPPLPPPPSHPYYNPPPNPPLPHPCLPFLPTHTPSLLYLFYLSLGGSGRIGDTSQKGNWSCFRNEILNSTTPTTLSYRTTVGDLPTSGILVSFS